MIPKEMIDHCPEVSSQKVINNKLIKSITSQELSSRQLAIVFTQYKYYCEFFPSILSIILKKCDNDKVSAILQLNLDEETGQVSNGLSHKKLFQDFLNDLYHTLGISTVDSIHPYTKSYINTITTFLSSSTMYECLGFIGPGTEEITPEQYQKIVSSLESYADLKNVNLGFFYEHLTADKYHSKLLWEAIEYYCQTPQDWERVKIGEQFAFKEELKFWDSMYELCHGR